MERILQSYYNELRSYYYKCIYVKFKERVERRLKLVETMEGVSKMFSKHTNRRRTKPACKHSSVTNLMRCLWLAIALVVAIQLSPTTVLAEENGLQTVYHIYVDGQYIGMLSDEDKLEEAKQQQLQKAVSEFENLSLTIGNELSIIPERVFTVDTADDEVLQKLQDTLAVEAEAVALLIDGEPALYVKDRASYDLVMRQLKLQTVTEQELIEFENRTATTSSLPHLKEDETRLTNITLSKDVEQQAAQTAPDNVLSTDEALTLLTKGSLKEKVYTVKKGDAFERIAKQHEMTTSDLLALNPTYTTETTLHIGDELNVTYLEPLVEVDVFYEEKASEVIPFTTEQREDETAFKGENTVTQQGADGKKEVTRSIQKRNGQVIEEKVIEENIVQEPVNEVTVVGTKVLPSRGTGSFSWPAVGGYISSNMGQRWGRMHKGIDIARPSSYSILASDNGVVTAAGWDGTYGNRIIIAHNNGYETLYAHLSSIDVSVGQTVPKGTKIGVMGSTGRSTGVHLHFEVFKNGSNINPVSVLN